MRRKAYSYMRFSSSKQADGDSLRRQTEARDALVKRRGFELDESLSLADLGVSAWKGDNAGTGALSVFLNLCVKGDIPKGSYLIVEHLDRLTRQHVRKALTLFFQILDAGVTIITLTPEREYKPDDKDPLSLIEPLILFAAANEKSETLSKRLREAWSEKRKKREPMTKWTPAWLRMKDDRSGYELIPDKAEIVRDIVRLSLSGYGDLRILRKLNDERVPVISGHRCWTNAYVCKILRTPALIGDYTPGRDVEGRHVLTGEVWEGYFPPVITKDEYYQLRAARGGRTHQRGPTGPEVANLFTGLLYNARDGELFHRIVKDMPRLISASYRNGLSGGDTVSVCYKPIEDSFLFGLAGDLKIHHLYGGKQASVKDAVVSLTAQLTDTESKIAVVKKKIADKPDVMAFLDVLADLDAKQRRLLGEIEQEKSRQAESSVQSEALDDLQALARLWAEKEGDKENLRTRLKAKIRQLVSGMWMVIYGKKKSKYKTAQVQIHFRAGGSVMLSLAIERDTIVTAELIHRSSDKGRGEGVDPFCDFRLLRDAEKGEEVRQYVATVAHVHDAFVESRLKYPAKPAESSKPDREQD